MQYVHLDLTIQAELHKHEVQTFQPREVYPTPALRQLHAQHPNASGDIRHHVDSRSHCRFRSDGSRPWAVDASACTALEFCVTAEKEVGNESGIAIVRLE
jgi:hypothetical protein